MSQRPLRDQFTQEIRRSGLLILLGWAVAVALIGLLAQFQPGWVAFAAILPAAIVGLRSTIPSAAPLMPATSASVPTTVVRPAAVDPNGVQGRLRELSREINRVSGALE